MDGGWGLSVFAGVGWYVCVFVCVCLWHSVVSALISFGRNNFCVINSRDAC